jgi:hypothetical protein
MLSRGILGKEITATIRKKYSHCQCSIGILDYNRGMKKANRAIKQSQNAYAVHRGLGCRDRFGCVIWRPKAFFRRTEDAGCRVSFPQTGCSKARLLEVVIGSLLDVTYPSMQGGLEPISAFRDPLSNRIFYSLHMMKILARKNKTICWDGSEHDFEQSKDIYSTM